MSTAPRPTTDSRALPTAALFDMDGLLLDSERLSLEAFVETIAHFELEAQPEVFYALVGANETAHLERLDAALGKQVDPAAFRRHWHARYMEVVSAAPVPVKRGVHELLQWFHDHDVACAVATSTNTADARHKLSGAGLLDQFRTVTGGDQVSRSKPAPDIYLVAARSIDADLRTSLAFEDSPNGVRSALAAGLDVVQVPDLIAPDDELLALGHRVHTDLLEVRDLLERETFSVRCDAGDLGS